ncbi:MAG: hypothetical protein IIU39_05650 [Ruminococcus sp.]|nr:hypothetical protein [Ruminococcus sp.]
MKEKKPADILFFIGVCVLIIGVLVGIALGFLFGEGGFNLVPSITVWLLCVVGGTGCITVSGSLTEAEEKKRDDEEFIKLLIESVKNEENKEEKEE